MSRKLRPIPFLGVFILVLLGSLPSGAQTASAQADPPLNFANNYFVRGDFTLAGAQGMLSNFTTINGLPYAVGTITVPDKNPGINPSVLTGSGSNAVPANAEIVAAVLYWQTVEKVGVTPGGPGSGQNGFFRPVITGGPAAPGYVISGVPLSSGSNAVSWSSGGCTTGSTGKIVRTYRANVASLLPRDINGNVLANNKYEVRLPGTSSTTPIAVGASLVLIYRLLNPNVPLNSIVIYDGDYAQSASSLVMSQTMQGFYDADEKSPMATSRLAHIVGNGKSNKFETVYLNGLALPSPYTKGEPPFPGYYGTWDNTVWSFDAKNTYQKLGNPVLDTSSSVTTEVMPSSSMGGCVSWGASIVSTTVKSSGNDGLLDSWKANGGYCDAAVNGGQCSPESASWVDLPDATVGKQDVYIQLDYMCSQVTGGDSCTTGDTTNYSFDPRLAIGADGINAVQKVVNAYAGHGITLHVNPPGTDQPDVHAIEEPVCQDNTATKPPTLCPFPNPPGTPWNLGVLTWTGGFYSIKGQLIDQHYPASCAGDCVPRFQPAAAPAKHYVVFGHAVGQPKWSLIGGSLTNVSQTGNTVTFTTQLPVGVLNSIATDPVTKNPIPDPTCTKDGRVTVFGAATNPYMNGTYCITSSTSDTFSIIIGGTATKTATPYTLATDPNIAVAPGYTSTASGVSDVGGANTYGSLGLWGNPALSTSDGQNPVFISGALMHEFGHSNGLAHGGPVASFIQGQTGATLSQILTNCKPNYQSAMSYSRLGDLAIDYSSGLLSSTRLNKSTPGTLLSGTGDTFWYVPYPAYVDAITGKDIGSAASSHCNGTAITNGAQMIRQGPFPLSQFSWKSPNPALPNSPDINFDGNTTETMLDLNDWANLDLAQIGATGANSSSSGPQFNGGGPQFNGGGPQFNGGGPQFNGGGPQFNGGGPQFNGGGEIDEATANSVTGSPQGVTATEAQSPRTITLNWAAPTFGQIGSYNVYRSSDGGKTFTKIGTVPGNPPATNFTDTNVNCNTTGYQYFVTAVLSSSSVNPGQESSPSNTVTVTSSNLYLMTGCYTNVPDPFTQPSPQTTPLTNAPPTQVKLNDLSFGTSPVIQGSMVPITWTLQDDNTSDYASPYVTRVAANSSLVAIGPVNSDGACPMSPPPNTSTILLTGSIVPGTAPNYQFSINWDTTQATAGCYYFQLTTDSGQTETTPPLSLLIYVSDSGPHVTTTNLPNGVVGSNYNNTLYEAGGTPPFTWTAQTGQGQTGLPSGVSFPAGLVNANQVTLAGTPAAPGIYTFMAKITDANNNYGMQTLVLKVADALFGDLVVADGSPEANPLSGTLYRITPTGTSGTIANIPGGMPDGVAVDANLGNIYVAVAPVVGQGSPSITQVGPFGGSNAFGPAGVLQSPVAVAVDSSSNVYVADNAQNAVYKFNSAGAQVDANGNPTSGAFATLSSSAPTLNHIRMAFDGSGNLFVGSDSIGGASGVVELDKVSSGGALTKVYANPVVTDSLTAAVFATTTYTGAFSPTIPTGTAVTIAGFSNGGNNGGPFTVVSSTGTTLVVGNANGVSESNAAGTLSFPLSGVSAVTQAMSSGGTVTYYGNFPPSIPVGSTVTISGFGDSNDGTFAVVNCCAGGQLIANNPGGTSESGTASATFAILEHATQATAATTGTTTTYTGAISAAFPPNSVVAIKGFANGPNNGSFTVASSTSTTLVVNNVSGVNESNPAGTAALTVIPDIGPVPVTDMLTVAAPSGSNTIYTGTFSPPIPAGSSVNIAGFTNGGNNGTFIVVSCTSTSLVVQNSGGVSESPAQPGAANFNLTAPIGSVGGVAVLSNGSIDVADPLGHAIYNLANPGASNMTITAAIGPLSSLCCYLTGMANPVSGLYVTLNGVADTAAITGFSINNGVVTFQAQNDFSPGTNLSISGLTVGTYLNGQPLIVTSSNGSEFQANFTYTNVPSTTDTGSATAVGSPTGLELVTLPTGPVSPILSGLPLTNANDVTWYDSTVTQH